MFDLSFSQFLLLVLVAWLVLASRDIGPHLRHLEHELLQRMPVFSAETTRHKEAEFIRDRLPKRPSWVLYGFATGLAMFLVALWWWLG
jgi:hypothetical protein